MPLTQGGWYAANHSALSSFISQLKPQDVLAFDWDNTCIFGDVGETVFLAQLQQLAINMAPDALMSLWHQACQLAGETPYKVALRYDLHQAYQALWPMMHQDKHLEASKSQAHKDFVAKAVALYQDMAAQQFADAAAACAAFMVLPKLWGQKTRAQINAFTEKSVKAALQAPLGNRHFISATAGEAGHVDVVLTTGLRAFAEMRDVFAQVEAQGAQAWVISASMQDIVRQAAKTLSFAVEQERILGLRVQSQGEVLLPQSMPAFPVTYRDGKKKALEAVAASPPCLVAGDQITDYEMLTGFKETQIRLIIHRDVKHEAMQRLYRGAENKDAAPLGGTTLLQGRNSKTGTFVPRQHSV